MKKTVIAGFAGLLTAAAFAGMNNVVVTFYSPGPDKYADGTKVVDGECYALVWTPEGSEFAGIAADGKAVPPSEVVIAAPVAKDGKCPPIAFQLDEAEAQNYVNGTWGVYLLDTRKFQTNADGEIITDEKGNKIYEEGSVGVDKTGQPKRINGYGAVAALSGGNASGAASASISVDASSNVPDSAKNLKIRKIDFVGDNVYVHVTGSLSCMSYELKSGDAPTEIESSDGGKPKYGTDEGDLLFIRKKKPGAQFFKVNSK
ncbi:MAG: hypothetical protein J6T51_06940 [Kiritimatiellae bacterium]|nr:hypothetical protein [Kiritimatiellia bacterium]